MSSKPRVAFFVSGLSLGGAERHTLDLRERLEERGYPTSLLVYGTGRSENLVALPGARNPVLLNCRGAFDPRSWLRVGRALAREQADVLFVINQTPTVTAIPFRWYLRSKVVGVFHSTLTRPGENGRDAVFRLAARFLDTLVFVSANQMRYWRARGLHGRRDAVIVNGIDLVHFAPQPADRLHTRSAWNVSPGDFVIGLVAAIRPEKNHPQLIDALAALREAGIPAKVVLVGDGPGRSALIQHIEARNMQAHVVFAGEQGDVRPAIAGFDVGVLCSTTETMSLSALEVLAMGIPMVMSNVGGASEIVQDGSNGYLFEVARTDQLVDRLTCLADPTERQRLAAAARPSASRFGVERMLNGYVNLIEDLTSKSRSNHASVARTRMVGPSEETSTRGQS
ncbi:glycosyltransferase [Methylobacterium haplocladii]|uniref:Glycosyl transferase n=1 Tax=Methylobacterium haplocladii TaxID=1176176 RepID=A0A512IVN8_9HYPH|nr:glycosyltransferase [Methylobacterium haplocladii]GEP01736.1 glycosyl transferase [Methylobacterium haplocladii]GJD83555.1 N-acetyl-alpha-D-glucosaminyl L-malate synthase [Methylobacterium haplocladii]GLS59729.1 glycosyl transferase [Methylobacterium haplocladii]